MPSKTAIKKERKQLATFIKSERLSRELSQDALAQRAGVDRKTVNRIENGHFSPSMDTFFRICGALGVKPVDVVKQVSKAKK